MQRKKYRKTLIINNTPIYRIGGVVRELCGALQVIGFEGAYLLTTHGELYRVTPYKIHLKNSGWERRLRIKQVLPRGRAMMCCLSYQGKRRDVALSTLKREVFG